MNIEFLAQPLSSSDGPCGDDLIFSDDFDEIQAARRFDDPTISQGEWVTEIKEADWVKVIRICETLLAERSKDLRIAAWLAEAKCKVDGLQGLADGYELISRLCEAFWNVIHPQPEDGEMEQRVGILDWLAQQTIRLIRETPLTLSDKGKYSLVDQETARSIAKKIEQNPRETEEIQRNATVTLERFEAAIKDTPHEKFRQQLIATNNLRNAVLKLQSVLDERMGQDAPSFSPTFETLDELSALLRRHGGVEQEAPPVSSEESKDSGKKTKNALVHEKIEPTIADMNDTDTLLQPFKPVRSREHAIQQLHEIAAFFRQTEPHSPVAYLAEKAAKWSAMPLHVWLRSVVKDNSSLMHMEELLGLDANKENDQSQS
jgi:type VI secretion system protein ImpA